VFALVPLIQTVLERTTRQIDAFRRVFAIVPLIQTVLERTTRLHDAFR
jgi:hypothetical protein